MCHLQIPDTLGTSQHPRVTSPPSHSSVRCTPSTLDKARGLSLKRPVCAIYIDRTKGRTEEIRLGYRVTVWLCPGHASHTFQTKRSGRDFVRTLMGVWQANVCVTAADTPRARRHQAPHTSPATSAPPTPPAATPSNAGTPSGAGSTVLRDVPSAVNHHLA